MTKREIIPYIVLGAFIGMLIPLDLMGSTHFNSADINTHASNIKDFLFGAPLKIAGVMGGAYGIVQSVLSGSPKPFFNFGAIGLGVGVMPTFIDGIFNVTSMLLP